MAFTKRQASDTIENPAVPSPGTCPHLLGVVPPCRCFRSGLWSVAPSSVSPARGLPYLWCTHPVRLAPDPRQTIEGSVRVWSLWLRERAVVGGNSLALA